MLVYELRWRLKVEKNVSKLVKILAANKFMADWITLIVIMRKK